MMDKTSWITCVVIAKIVIGAIMAGISVDAFVGFISGIIFMMITVSMTINQAKKASE